MDCANYTAALITGTDPALSVSCPFCLSLSFSLVVRAILNHSVVNSPALQLIFSFSLFFYFPASVMPYPYSFSIFTLFHSPLSSSRSLCVSSLSPSLSSPPSNLFSLSLRLCLGGALHYISDSKPLSVSKMGSDDGGKLVWREITLTAEAEPSSAIESITVINTDAQANNANPQQNNPPSQTVRQLDRMKIMKTDRQIVRQTRSLLDSQIDKQTWAEGITGTLLDRHALAEGAPIERGRVGASAGAFLDPPPTGHVTSRPVCPQRPPSVHLRNRERKRKREEAEGEME